MRRLQLESELKRYLDVFGAEWVLWGINKEWGDSDVDVLVGCVSHTEIQHGRQSTRSAFGPAPDIDSAWEGKWRSTPTLWVRENDALIAHIPSVPRTITTVIYNAHSSVGVQAPGAREWSERLTLCAARVRHVARESLCGHISHQDKINVTCQARHAHPQAHTMASDRINTHDNSHDQLAAPRPSRESQLSTSGIAPQHSSARTQYFLTRDPNVPRPTPTVTCTNITARASMRPGHLDNVPIRLPDSGLNRRPTALSRTSHSSMFLRIQVVGLQLSRPIAVKESRVLVYAVSCHTVPEDLRARLASHSFYTKFSVLGRPRVHSIHSLPLSRVIHIEVASKAGPLAVLENSS
ncbi:hypothetical protein BD779DRAFT_1477128 [Infundibulicybe gibba]|nr:hypothetical protein BD779DRAFT_1477128 [Infundibulicybe gibba]